MDKRSFYLNNPTRGTISVLELNISLPPGISNLFELNPDLSFDQIDYSMRKGTLRSAMENRSCLIVPDVVARSISTDVIVRNPHQIQMFSNRNKFQVIETEQPDIFDPIDDVDLFETDVKPARQIEEELRRATEDNVQAIEATVKEAKLPEKPIETRYTAQVKTPEVQEKIKNDLTMGYETCNGFTAEGKKCLRRAKTGKGFCSFHKNQATTK